MRLVPWGAAVIGFAIITSAFISCAPVTLPSQTPSITPLVNVSLEQRIQTAILRGVDYLRGQYDEEVGLLPESPNVAPHKYWLFNDNALAAYTLERLGEREVATNLSATLQRYGYTTNGLQEALWGAVVVWPPRVPNELLVKRIGTREVWIELSNGEGHFGDWADYTNLAMFGAQNEYHHGNQLTAIQIFQRAVESFDGVGFKDKAFKGDYETYKLALTLYTGLAIRAPLDGKGDTLVEALLQKQASSGGFHTHYTGPRTLAGDTNTETTSLVLLALDEYLKWVRQ